MKTVLIANRGEVALRILDSAAELGLRTVAIFSEDDSSSPHVRRADEAVALVGRGVAAYCDIEQIVALAQREGCDAIHPGYGFLSEVPRFAAACADRGLIFVGPSAATLAELGDKSRARDLASRLDVPVLRGTRGDTTAVDARAFFASLPAGGAMVIKAIAGGGGRGMRVVHRASEIDEADARCRSEAKLSFGDERVYCEEWLPGARHIEIQILGDGSGAIVALGERECSIQRRHQKLIEIAPCPRLHADLRARLVADAVRMAASLRYRGAGTFEFLVSEATAAAGRYAFIEANPRLQVEHPVTEVVYGVDVVRTQLELAAGRSLAELGFEPGRALVARGFAIELRLNAEILQPDGTVRPAAGTIRELSLPRGRGVRVDSAAYAGGIVSPSFDSLVAKLIGSSGSPQFRDAVARTRRLLDEVHVAGISTNRGVLARILDHPDFIANAIDTQFVESHLAELVVSAEQDGSLPMRAASLDRSDPLAVLAYGKGDGGGGAPTPSVAAVGRDIELGELPSDAVVVRTPMQATVVSVDVGAGDRVSAGRSLLVLNAMKMEHVIEAPAAGVIERVLVSAGETIADGCPVVVLRASEMDVEEARESAAVDLDAIRADLAEVRRRHAFGDDANRPEAIARRRKTGQRSARENIADICDDGSFVEYGGLALAAQRQRRSLEDLVERTPADGLVAGVGRVNGEHFDEARSRCVVMSYDYTVLAGTQGFLNHRKKDRMFELAERMRLPVVFFTEGGGGRPGDTDAPGVSGLDCMAFHLFAKLSGLVPLVGINSGRCFAGNAALLGCCDVVIATAGSNIGMGGPAMIEGGGLGVFRPEDVGPMSVQVPNGVVDIAVADEEEGVRKARQYLSYFQGALSEWQVGDQRQLRSVIPENRLRVYEVRRALELLADTGSVLELRPHFGVGMVTALARIEGRPLGVIANNPKHLSGAIDSAAADKAARFMQLCDAFDLPILFLCDTPGIMVGPEAEGTALVRHASRMFTVGSNISVPFFTIVLRKSYGLGAQAMGGGSHKSPLFTVSWPTGEFGGMGLEGAVKLGFRKELEAIADPDQRRQMFEMMVARAYERGGALNTASHFEIDDVIDPADSRRWVSALLHLTPPPGPRQAKKRPCIDTW